MSVPTTVTAKFIAFAVVGVFGTISHYIVLWILVEGVYVPILPATTAGFIVGAVVNYSLNRKFTFTSNAPHVIALPKFLTIATVGAGLNVLIMAMLLEVLKIHYLIIQLIATSTVLIWNFVANYVWTFRN